MAFLLMHGDSLPRSEVKAAASRLRLEGMAGRVHWVRVAALSANLLLWGAIVMTVRAVIGAFG